MLHRPLHRMYDVYKYPDSFIIYSIIAIRHGYAYIRCISEVIKAAAWYIIKVRGAVSRQAVTNIALHASMI